MNEQIQSELKKILTVDFLPQYLLELTMPEVRIPMIQYCQKL